ncbi:hypothetical protein FACS1894152_7680 [Bacilli bacterium]|nr:hypothetical protein FACS1894152_7680 [Bacilli bacterium]
MEDNGVEERIMRIMPFLNERQRRLFLGNEALAQGYGGVSAVIGFHKSVGTHISFPTHSLDAISA